MKIAIVVYSISGHTLRAARRLEEALTSAGHMPTIMRLETVGPMSVSAENAPLKDPPVLNGFDGVVFCAPVRGGNIPPPVALYLQSCSTLISKKTACLVTHFFRPEWGAQQTIAALRAACESRGTLFCGAESVRWFLFNRGRSEKQAVETLTAMFD